MVKYFRLSPILRTRLEEAKVDVAGTLRRARLPRDLFEQSRVLLTTDEVFALYRAIGEESENPGIGLTLGTESRLERFHPMGLAVLSAETFGSAMEHMSRFKRLSAPEEIIFERDAHEWVIHFRYLLAPEEEPTVLVDQTFAWVLTIGRRGTGEKITPLRIELMQPRKNIKRLETHFGCPVVIGSARNAVVFDAKEYDHRFVTQNAELLNIIGSHLNHELEMQTSEDSFVELVRGAIQQRLNGHRPTVGHIAQDLRLSSRTVQRRLQDAGVNFQSVLDNARHQMARYYLRNSLLELTEAAYLLGYEDSASFARAFRGWEGVAPSVWRDTNTATPIN